MSAWTKEKPAKANTIPASTKDQMEAKDRARALDIALYEREQEVVQLQTTLAGRELRIRELDSIVLMRDALLAAREARIVTLETALFGSDVVKLREQVASLTSERNAAVQETGRLRRALAILSQLGGTRSEGNMLAQRALDGLEA